MKFKLPEGKKITTVKQAQAQFKESILRRLKDKITGQRRRMVTANALSFSRTHKDVLVIIADPKKDDIILAYNNHYAVTKVVSKYFRRGQKIIKHLINRTERDEKMADKKVNEFLAILDAFLYKFSLKINESKVVQNTNQSKDEHGQENKEGGNSKGGNS